MIKATELRIGNLILDSMGGQECTVFEIKPHAVRVKRADYLKPHIDNETVFFGIALTEDWLLKFGFYIIGGNTSESHYQITPDGLREFNLNHIKDSNQFFFSDVELKSIHQLQNLYFALTGEELTLKK